jgi:hypothetical protein
MGGARASRRGGGPRGGFLGAIGGRKCSAVSDSGYDTMRASVSTSTRPGGLTLSVGHL